MKKLMLILLCVTLLLPSMLIFVSAYAGTLTNLYSAASVGIPSKTSASAPVDTANKNYYASQLISVNTGDTIYFGPVLTTQQYYLTSYTASGAVVTDEINLKNENVKIHKSFDVENVVICEWTVPVGTAQFRMATSQMFSDSTLITKNEPFDVATYISYMEANGVNVDCFKSATTDTLVNKFPKSNSTFDGQINANGTTKVAAQYHSSDFIAVNPGDMVYIAAAKADQGYHMVLFGSNKTALNQTITKDYMIQYEDLGRGYLLLGYRVRSDAYFVRVVAASGVYEDGIELVTVNQRFTGEQYRQMFNISLEKPSPTRPESSLNGKKMLFMGDSITYGLGDSPSYLDEYGLAWAGRIARETGAVVTNAGVSGASLSYLSESVAPSGKKNDGWGWIYDQFSANKSKSFDVVVMHGGVNDARYEREIGEISDSTDSAVLKANIDTFAGGLQYLFENVTKTYPNADLFYIANHHLDGHSKGYADDMSAYFAKAKVLCEKYGIHLINLYDNEELNETLNPLSTTYLEDTLHPNAAAYDIITPYIIKELEAVVKATVVTPPAENGKPEATPEGTVDNGNADPEKDGLGLPVILAIAGGSAVAVGGGATVAILTVKKKKKKVS